MHPTDAGHGSGAPQGAGTAGGPGAASGGMQEGMATFTGPRCPRCGSADVEPCDEIVRPNADESIHATHRCRDPRCEFQPPFLYQPPIPGFTGTEVVV